MPPSQVDTVASRSYIAGMKSVGLRELKNRLSEYVRYVRAGHGILVTDRGQVVAELRPPGSPGGEVESHPGLAALAKRGSLSIGAPNDATLYPPLPESLPRGRARLLLDQERGEH